MNYTRALVKLAGRERRKLENNTYLEKRGDSIAVKLHKTDVVTLNPDGSSVYSSGGWRTVTTKDRINTYGDISISQVKGQWIVNNTHLFADGMKLDGGVISNAPTYSKTAQKENAKHKRVIKTYVESFIEALINGKVHAPSGGDCWGCLMVTKDGERPLGRDCIKQHIKDKYFVPSLIVRAADRFGMSPYVRGLIGEIWQGKTLEGFYVDVLRRDLGRCLYRLIKENYGMAS